MSDFCTKPRTLHRHREVEQNGRVASETGWSPSPVTVIYLFVCWRQFRNSQKPKFVISRIFVVKGAAAGGGIRDGRRVHVLWSVDVRRGSEGSQGDGEECQEWRRKTLQSWQKILNGTARRGTHEAKFDPAVCAGRGRNVELLWAPQWKLTFASTKMGGWDSQRTVS